MYKIIMLAIIVLTIFILIPFFNGFGCNFNFQQSNSIIDYSVKCKNGFILSDFYDKVSGKRIIRRSIYGYWDGSLYKIPFYKKTYTNTEFSHANISPLSRYEILNLWSVSLFKSRIDGRFYFFLKDHQGVLFSPDFNERPKYGFLDFIE